MARGGLLALAVLVAGCAPRARQVVSPTTADDLLARLAGRRAAITSLRARARVKSGLARLWTREAVVVRRPDGVRIDVLSPFGLVLALGTDGSQLWAYPPSQGVRYEGPATPNNVSRFLGAPVAVPDLVDLLLGLPPERQIVGQPAMLPPSGGQYCLSVPFQDGMQTLWFAADTLSLVRAEETRSGTIVLRAAFGDYRDGFPHLLDVSAPSTGAAATLAYDTVEPNSPADEMLFAPPAAPRVLPLEAAPRN